MTTTSRRSPVQGMRRGVLVAGSVGTVLVTIGGALAKGADGALSALAGSLLAFFVVLLGLVAITAVIKGEPGLSMAGAAVVFLGQLILLAAAVASLRRADWLDGPTAASSAAIVTLLLQAGQIAGYVRSRHVLFPEESEA